MTGDSQALGTLSTADQAAAVASYTVTPKVKVRNTAGAWVTYTPGTMTGISFATDDGRVGMEMAYIQKLRAAHPNDTLYIHKDTATGSFQARGVTTGNATVSGSGNSLTVNSGAVPSNTLLIGAGIVNNDGKALYSPFAGFLTPIGVSGGANATAFTSVVAAKYNGTLSWSITEGLAYNGNSGGITNGVRARLASSIADLTAAGLSPRIVTWEHVLGTNDMSNSTTGAAFATDLANMLARFRTDFNLSQTKIILPRVGTGVVASTTVRAAQQARADADADVFLIDTDAYTRWDGTHWDLVGQTGIGNDAYNITWNGALGI